MKNCCANCGSCCTGTNCCTNCCAKLCSICNRFNLCNRNNYVPRDQQQAVASDIMAREAEDVEQHGGPALDCLIVLMAKVLPFSEELLRRIIWILVWGWKAAPVALYESLANRDQGYFTKWWQKTISIPSALGFYYFLYDNVATQILDSFQCCGSDFVYQAISVGIVGFHFITGLSMHFWQQRKAEREAQEVELQQRAKASSKSTSSQFISPGMDGNKHDYITMDDNPNTNSSSSSLPRKQHGDAVLDSTTPEVYVYPEGQPAKESKRKKMGKFFTGIMGKKKGKNKADLQPNDAAIV